MTEQRKVPVWVWVVAVSLVFGAVGSLIPGALSNLLPASHPTQAQPLTAPLFDTRSDHLLSDTLDKYPYQAETPPAPAIPSIAPDLRTKPVQPRRRVQPEQTSQTGQSITGRVVSVHDGDTLTILTSDHTQQKIRLYGIDAPEKGQPFGERAKQALSSYTFGEDVTIEVSGTDKYGRTIGMIEANGVNVNEAMVRDGYAWWYREYAKNSTTLSELEATARLAGVGLWADPNAIAPWIWRHPTSAESVTPTFEPEASGLVYITRTGRRYHRSGCGSLRSSMQPCTVDEARALGLTPCQVCRP